ncbi:MAG: cation:proton antiporter, partial [bacterium]
MTEAPFFQDIALVFIAALAGGALAQWLRQPLFVGYIIGGLLISPFTPGPSVQDLPTFELFAQIGVILLMFSIGIEFSLHEMTRLGAPAILGAPLVMGLTILLAIALGGLLGWPVSRAATVGVVVAVASTMVVVKLMAERGETSSPHSRLSIGTLLT